LRAKLGEVNVSDRKVENDRKEVLLATEAKKAADDKLEPLKEQVKLQELLVAQLLEMAKATDETVKATKALAKAVKDALGELGGETGIKFPTPDVGNLTKTIDDTLEKAKAAIKRKLADLFSPFAGTAIGKAANFLSKYFDLRSALANVSGVNEHALSGYVASLKAQLETLVPGGDFFKALMGTALGPSGEKFVDAFRTMASKLGAVVSIIMGILSPIATWFEETSKTAGTDIGKWIEAISGELSRQWPVISAQLSDWAKRAWDWLTAEKGPINTAAKNIGDWISSISAQLLTQWPTISEELFKWVDLFWKWLIGPGGVVSKALTNLNVLLDAISTWVKSPEAQATFSQAGQNIGLSIIDAQGVSFKNEGSVGGILSLLITTLLNLINTQYALLVNIGKAIGAGIFEGIEKGLAEKFGSFSLVKFWWDSYKKYNPASFAWGVGNDIVSGIEGGINDGQSSLNNTMSDSANQGYESMRYTLGIRSPSTLYYDLGKGIIDGLVLGINENATSVNSAMGAVATAAVNGLQPLADSMQPLIDSLAIASVALWGTPESFGGALTNVTNVLGGNAGLLSDLDQLKKIASGAEGSIADPLSAALWAVRDAAAEAGSAVGGVVGGLENIRAMDGMITHVWVLTHEQTVYEKDIDNTQGAGPYVPGVPTTPTCFVAGTLVWMANGTHKPIEEVRVGDSVCSYDTETREFLSAKVTETFQHAPEESCGYYFLDDLRVTREHLLFVNGEWKAAQDVEVGDTLLDENSKPYEVTRIEWWGEPCKTYNLHTDHPTHNYFAGGMLVHNAKATEEYQHGGYNPFTQLALIHAGEVILSREMLAGRIPVPYAITQHVTPRPMMQTVYPSKVNNIAVNFNGQTVINDAYEAAVWSRRAVRAVREAINTL
jgi:hypothetical protein